MIEQFFICPHCLQEISMLIDPSIKQQSYVEDCEVCCNPIQLTLQIEENEVISFSADMIQ